MSYLFSFHSCVPAAIACDHCGAQADYWHPEGMRECRDCMEHTCERCDEASMRLDGDDGRMDSTVCRACYAERPSETERPEEVDPFGDLGYCTDFGIAQGWIK